MKMYLQVMVLVLLGLLITGCGMEKPEQAVTNAVEALSRRDVETATNYFAYDHEAMIYLRSDFAQEDEITRLLLERLEAEVLSTKKRRDQAVVEVEITNIDLDAIYNEYVDETVALSLAAAFSEKKMPSEEEMVAYFIDLLSREDTPMQTTIVEVNLRKVGSNWVIEMDDILEKAVSGGQDNTFREIGMAFRAEA